MKKLRKAVKIKGHHMWDVEGPGLQYKKKFAGKYLALIEFKRKPTCVLLDNIWEDRKFHSIQLISPSEARDIIGWLARYIAFTDPDPISLAIAATKSHAKLIEHEQNKVAQELGLK